MDFVSCLVVLGALYGALFFFDNFFKSCAHYPYIQFLQNTGFEIGFFHLKWKTTFFNRIILRMGSGRTRFAHYWFDAGLIVSLGLFPVAVGLLLVANYQLITFGAQDISENKLVLEPLVPGYNLPASEIGYYAITLLVCSVVHEFGHVLAAVKEDVQVTDVGVKVFLFVSVAYVNISSEKLSSIGQWRFLRIMCAGIWHNLVLVLCAGILYLSLPLVMSPLYVTGDGVIVTDVAPQSPLAGNKGLYVSNTVTGINDCIVKDEYSWTECLSRARSMKPGYCITTDLAHELDESGPLTQVSGAWDCCAPSTPQNMCFEYLEQSGGIVELPPHMCLPARRIIEAAHSHCYHDEKLCKENLHCIRPLLSNLTSLLVFKREGFSNVVYIGHPSDVFLTVSVSSFVPKYTFPNFNFAVAIHKLLKYLIVFSSGLAILNILPCLFFDGQHIVTSVVAIMLRDRLHRQKIQNVSNVTIVLGTILLFFNFTYTMWSLAFRT